MSCSPNDCNPHSPKFRLKLTCSTPCHHPHERHDCRAGLLERTAPATWAPRCASAGSTTELTLETDEGTGRD